MTTLEHPAHETLPRDEHLERIDHLERTAQALWSVEPTRSADGRVDLMMRLSAVSARLERQRILLEFDLDTPADPGALRECVDELSDLTDTWLSAA
ncbi:MAG: hypothetical protein AB8G26_12730 [Ilumatobacter sp.]